MRYAELEQRIEEMAAAASEDARRCFALDTIRLLKQAAEQPSREELTVEEQRLLSTLLNGLESQPDADLAATLEQLNASMCRDPVRAIEFHPSITELLCAIDNWLGYRRSGDPHRIADVAINAVNHVDYVIGGDARGYSISNMLGAPEMVAEFHRQRRLLVPASG
jgi:hypothetical protein